MSSAKQGHRTKSVEIVKAPPSNGLMAVLPWERAASLVDGVHARHCQTQVALGELEFEKARLAVSKEVTLATVNRYYDLEERRLASEAEERLEGIEERARDGADTRATNEWLRMGANDLQAKAFDSSLDAEERAFAQEQFGHILKMLGAQRRVPIEFGKAD